MEMLCFRLKCLPDTFGELSESLFSQLPKEPRVDFVTDSYHPLSIKSVERNRRGSSTAYIIKGPMTKIPRDWKNFLANDKNKQSLNIFLLNEWKKDKFARMLMERKVYFVCADMCTCLKTTDGQYIIPEDIDELRSNQEEADTKIVLHCLHIAAHSSSDFTITV